MIGEKKRKLAYSIGILLFFLLIGFFSKFKKTIDIGNYNSKGYSLTTIVRDSEALKMKVHMQVLTNTVLHIDSNDFHSHLNDGSQGQILVVKYQISNGNKIKTNTT